MVKKEAAEITFSFIRIGSANAKVFPEPVGAHAKHSRPCIAICREHSVMYTTCLCNNDHVN